MPKRRFGFPEWFWASYAALMLALMVGATAGRNLLCGIAAEVLSLPAGWLLSSADWYSALPAGLMWVVFFIVALVNGGLFYGCLKFIERLLSSRRAPKA